MRTGRFERLIKAFDRFHSELSDASDERLIRLRRTWFAYKREYPEALRQGVRKQQLATGLEQGLRELPMLLRSMKPHVRRKAAAAYEAALASYAPEFIERDRDRLQRILDRNRIRGESEFHLVRNRIDMLEGRVPAPKELDRLYELVAAFEVSFRRS